MDNTGTIGRGGVREVNHPTLELIDEKELIQPDPDLLEEMEEKDIPLVELTGNGNMSKWYPSHKIMAATYYLILNSYTKVAEHMAAAGYPVPRDTIASWRNRSTWWKPLITQIRKAKQDELDSKLTKLIHSGIDALQDRFNDGEYVVTGSTEEGDPIIHRVPVKARDLSMATSIMYDKRALSRGDPTSRVQRDPPEKLLKDLAREFEKMAQKNRPAIEAIKTEYTVENENEGQDSETIS